MIENLISQRHLRIYGDVHAVGFRFEAKRLADRLGINGWIRNNPNGTVEVEFVGKKNQLKAFENWCQKGPRFARVDRIEELPINTEAHFDDFVIL